MGRDKSNHKSYKMIVEIINNLFMGDVKDPRPLHANSICRFAYVGYLRSTGHNTRETQNITGYTYGSVRHRYMKHKEHLKFNPEYRKKFTCLKNS